MSEDIERAFTVPILRNLDETSRQAIRQAARVREIPKSENVYLAGSPSDSIYVVLAGSVELLSHQQDRSLRVSRSGETFGEEAILPGLSRRTSAKVIQESRVVEIPIAVFRRASGRRGASADLDRERRYLYRGITRDLLRSSALSPSLRDTELDALADTAELRRFHRNERIYPESEHSDAVFLVAEGLVQQGKDGGFVGRSQLFGWPDQARRKAAISCGDTWCVRIPADAFVRSTEAVPQLRQEIVAPLSNTEANTSGSSVDLYRLQVARSLLVIDQDSCVRCGHCAWSCSSVHRESRLLRRGQNLALTLRSGKSTIARTLSLPNNCQHCKNAACMIDCPTAAIGRDDSGEVFIRESLCTGCGSCAKSCPWDNIQMGPRDPPSNLSESIAVKCDLCRDYEGPACVQACPTEAIFRIDPQRDLSDLQQLAPQETATSPMTPRETPGSKRHLFHASLGGLCILFVGLSIAVWRAEFFHAARGWGLLAGVVGGLAIVGLTAYILPKRGVHLWMRRRRDGKSSKRRSHSPPSRLRPFLRAHLFLGALAISLVGLHGGFALPNSPAGALLLSFWIATLSGGFGALTYRVLPARLTRLERRSDLPEDLAGQGKLLQDRLYEQMSGRDELVKAIADKILLPYSRSYAASLSLLVSGRTIAEEEERLRVHIDTTLESRGRDRRQGLDELIENVVAIRALPIRRLLLFLLRAWLPVHILAVAMTIALFFLHLFLVFV